MREMNPTKATDSANNHPVAANIDKVKAFGQTRTPVTRRNSCPAWGKICAFCKGRNHFESKCRKKTKKIILQLILMTDG